MSYSAATRISRRRDRRSRRERGGPLGPRSRARACAGPARCGPGGRSPCRRRQRPRAGRGRARPRAPPSRRAPPRGRRPARAPDTRAALPLPLDSADLDQARDRLGGLCALAEPVLDLPLVELDRRGVGLRVVATDDLEELAVPRGPRVGRDNAVDRVLLRAHAGEPQLDCHPSPYFLPALRFLRFADARRVMAGTPFGACWVGRAGIFPFPSCFIMRSICFRASSSWFTCSTVAPEPFAILIRRCPSITIGERRSCGVIESTIASTRAS